MHVHVDIMWLGTFSCETLLKPRELWICCAFRKLCELHVHEVNEKDNANVWLSLLKQDSQDNCSYLRHKLAITFKISFVFYYLCECVHSVW
jgi:hypothetical protein